MGEILNITVDDMAEILTAANKIGYYLDRGRVDAAKAKADAISALACRHLTAYSENQAEQAGTDDEKPVVAVEWCRYNRGECSGGSNEYRKQGKGERQNGKVRN